MSPPEFHQLLGGCTSASGGRLSALVFPRVTNNAAKLTLRRLQPAEVLVRFPQGLFRASQPTVLGEVFVAYALGNFVFDQDWSIPTQQGVVLEAAFHGAELKGVRLLPIRIVDRHQPTFADPVEASEILGHIWAASAELQ